MSRQITSATSLDNLKKEAKRWLKALRDGDAEARARLERAYAPAGPAKAGHHVPGAAGPAEAGHHVPGAAGPAEAGHHVPGAAGPAEAGHHVPRAPAKAGRHVLAAPATPVLRDVQHALALEHGRESWIALKQAVETPQHDRLTEDMLLAFNAHDEQALQRLNDHDKRLFSFEDLWAEIWRRVYSFRQRAFRGTDKSLRLDEAQTVVAQNAGFGSWKAFTEAAVTGASPVPAYVIDEADNTIGPARILNQTEWDGLIAVMKERRLTACNPIGLLTDALLARIVELDHVTSLTLGGSRELTDDGLLKLARMPQLQHLSLSEFPGGNLTDRGLEVLRHLPNLRRFDMTWQRGITDAGVANLKYCDELESVDLMGTQTGDGAIEALQGKAKLHRFHSGRQVTDRGLRFLRNFSALKDLLIDGPFTNDGLASLAGLDGVVDLDLFWHVTGITSDGFAHLAGLPSLESLGADGALTDNVAMRHIGALPTLRKLRAQESVATDEGFEALSRSRTLENLWGRVCPNFGSRGFIALSTMPALRRFGIGCKNVNDDALSRLPQFPALREITPIDFQDDGFRHIGRCERLEHLQCMYCRETTDAATEHVAGLRLLQYYAGLTKITDRSLEIMGRMPTLERIEFYECNGITDAGLVFLAALPRLREIHMDGLPGVTHTGTRVFPAHVRVKYST
jgi:hypothetical protein